MKISPLKIEEFRQALTLSNFDDIFMDHTSTIWKAEGYLGLCGEAPWEAGSHVIHHLVQKYP